MYLKAQLLFFSEKNTETQYHVLTGNVYIFTETIFVLVSNREAMGRFRRVCIRGRIILKVCVWQFFLCVFQVSVLGTLRRPDRTVRQLSKDNTTCITLEKKIIRAGISLSFV